MPVLTEGAAEGHGFAFDDRPRGVRAAKIVFTERGTVESSAGDLATLDHDRGSGEIRLDGALATAVRVRRP